MATLPSRRLEVAELRSAQWRRLLAAYDYHRQLERGYSVTRDADGSVVRTASSLQPGQRIVTQLSDGAIGSEVTEVGTNGDRPLPDEEGTG